MGLHLYRDIRKLLVHQTEELSVLSLEVTIIYRRLRIGRDSDLHQIEAYDIL